MSGSSHRRSGTVLDKLGDWLDDRLGHRAFLQQWLDRPIPGGARWAYVLGALVVADFVILAVTGVLLSSVYAPSPQTAWASVHYVSTALAGGWLVRGMHAVASNALIVLVGAHVGYVVLVGAYKKPHEPSWWLLLLAALLVFALVITGELLPWDQQGYWARRVEAGIVGMSPVIGDFVQRSIQGGAQLGALGLSRAHAMHVVVLPALFALVLWGRARLVRRNGYAMGVEGAAGHDPYATQVARNLFGATALFVLVLALAWLAHGAPLDAPADPASDYPARPEWFLLPLFQLRKYFSGKGEFYGTAVLPGVIALYAALLPFVDRRPGARFSSRIPALFPLLVAAVAAPALGWIAWRHDAHDPQYLKARAKADERAAIAFELAKQGVPPSGPLEMLRNDPELRGHDLFEEHCASCHVLGDLGDRAKASAPVLDGWSTEAWLVRFLHDPDAEEFFGRTPYKGEMPPVDVATPDAPPMTNAEGLRAAARFLALQGTEPDVTARPDDPIYVQGEKLVTERCTTCHLFGGEGDDGGSGIAPELRRYGSIAWVRAQIANPSSAETYREDALDESRKGHMPRFDRVLSPEDIDLLARWTRARARGEPLAVAEARP